MRPVSPRYNRCSPWLAGWDMKCVLLPHKRMPRDSNLEVDHPLIRTGGSALRHGLAEITPGSSVSVADNSDICNHVARSWTLPYRLNQLAGFSSRTVANRETAIIKRETSPTPVCTCIIRPPFHLHALHRHYIITRLRDHLYSSTNPFASGNRRLVGESGSSGDTGGVSTGYYRWEGSTPQYRSDHRTWRGAYTTGNTIIRPVGRLVGHDRGSAHRGGCTTDFRSGSLVPGGMDWRSLGGLPGGLPPWTLTLRWTYNMWWA